MSDPNSTPPPAFDSSSLFDDPTPKRVPGPPPDEKGSPVLVAVLAVAAVVIVGAIVFSIVGSSSSDDDDTPEVNTGVVALDPVARFHERTDRLFDDSVSREQREAIGKSVCEAVESSSDPRTVQDFFRDRFAEGDVKLLFEASANAWCPQHAGALVTG